MLKARFARAALGIALILSASACVTLPPNSPRVPQDPWESWNRGVYKVNDKLDRAVVKPVAKGYVRVVPSPIRTGVTNFFANLNMTTVMFNDALQGKLLAAGTDLGRFLLNSTVGIGGILDPATPAGLAHNNNDFGVTLGHWGVHSGPFLELPLLGPSDVRDGLSEVVDTYTDPRQYIHNNYVRYGLFLPHLIDVRASLLSLDETLKNVYDPYAFIRDAYLQRRAYLVSDGKSAPEEPLVDPGEDMPDSKASPPVPALPPASPSPPTPPPAPAQPKTEPPPASTSPTGGTPSGAG
jgi:phospholipid-binding lipoprotein MlaA